MQAMNGSDVLGIRRFKRLFGCLVALLAVSAMTLPSIASAKANPIKHTILGLGDSLAFGYSQQVFNENILTGDQPSNFKGWVEDYLAKENPAHTQVTNDGCPGETTESFIGNNPALIEGLNQALYGPSGKPSMKQQEEGAVEVTGEAPCAYHNEDNLPLHHEYEAGQSQLENALQVIAVDGATKLVVKKITLNIGNNDALHIVAKVEKEAEAYVFTHVVKPAAEKKCEEKAEELYGPGTGPTYGPAVCASEYAPGVTVEEAYEYEYSHTEPGEKHDAEVGHEFASEHIAAEVPGLIAHENSNLAGIFAAIRNGSFFGGVDYKSQIIMNLAYDPYGAVFVAGEELQPGFRELQGLLNLFLAKTAHTPAFGGNHKMKQCTFNSEAAWNPGDATEPERLKEWTNMANFTPWEDPNHVVLQEGGTEKDGPFRSDGPDIHPTPAGYQQMANEAFAACG